MKYINKNYMKQILGIALLICLCDCLMAQTLKDELIIVNEQGCKVLDPYYSDGITMKWDGPCINGKANGFGKLTKYSNGEYESTYEGEYKNGIREGKGTFTHKDGSVAKGNFVNGQLSGFGSRISDEQGKYEGEFFNYRQHGKGTYYFANGSKFEGFFVSDRMYTGKFINYDGKVSYYQQYYPVSEIKENPSSYKPELGVKLTEYYDEKWKRCKQKDASYYRMVTYESENKPKGLVRDFYIDGQLQSEFTCPYLDYDDEGKNFHEGESTWYYKNGQVQQKRYYYNNNINGINTFYYENGEKSLEVEYSMGYYNGDYKQWYKNGKLNLIALYESGKLVESKYIEYDENGLGALVYNENFQINKDSWIGNGENYKSTINEKNQLEFKLTESQSISLKNYISLEQKSSYSIESIIQKKIGKGTEGYGVIFGFKDWDNYYQFLISEYGSYMIRGKFEGMDVNITEWTKSNAINTKNQRNQIKVFKYDDEFIFSINGQVVEKTKSKTLRGNYCGIIVNGKGDYVMENLIVKEFLTTEDLDERAPKRKSLTANEWKGNGSGFFINEKGYIATNYHVVENAKEIQVEYFQKGIKNVYKAKVIVTDKQNDLAIIQIKDSKFKLLSTIPYVFNTIIKDVGTDVFALGYPIADVMGEEIKFTDGKISSKTGIHGDITVYQISVPIQPGNSGGPLFDSKGNLVGITSSALNKEYYASENVNYAIKISYLKNLIDVMPESITLPNNTEIYNKSLTDKIKLLSDFIPIIKVK